jgi:protease-4
MDPATGVVPPPIPGNPFPAGVPMPPAQRAGCGRVLLRVFVVLLLLGSLALNLLMLLGSSLAGSESNVVQSIITPGDERQVIAAVSLAGAIDGVAATRFDHALDAVEKDNNVKVLVLEIDSPGGTVTGSDEIHGRVQKYKAARQAAGKNATVVVTVRSMALSGGYYVACAGDYVVAEQTSSAGNIGVLISQFNVSKLMSKYGVEDTTVVSSGADFKTVGSPFQPETEAGRQYTQDLADQAFARFKAVVVQGRGSKLTTQPAHVCNGKVFFGPEALKLGLIDQVGFPDDAYAYAAKVAGVSNPHIVRYHEPGPGLLSTLLQSSSTSGQATSDGGASMSPPDLRNLIRPETLDAWRTARLLYR